MSASQDATARNKKRLSVSDSTEFTRSNAMPSAMDKSFLLPRSHLAIRFFSKKKAFAGYFPFADLGSYEKSSKTSIR
jgi:hypothetical protein